VSTAAYPSGLTWDEFLALPHELRNAALIDGEVVVNPPTAQHELVVQNLTVALRQWMRAAPGRGEVSTQQPVKVDDGRGYQPDFAWYPPERCAPPRRPPSFDGLPALVVEVLSPSTRAFDLLRKRSDYEHVGIDEVWFVDPDEQAVLSCQRSEAGAPFASVELRLGDTLTSRLLPAFAAPVTTLFER
jgi:Uma2 family endonuclease